jgi:hypothetical protein
MASLIQGFNTGIGNVLGIRPGDETKNLSNKFVAAIGILAIVIPLMIFFIVFYPYITTFNTYFPPGFCKDATECLNSYGPVGKQYWDTTNSVMWYFLFYVLIFVCMLGGFLIGGFGKLGNTAAVGICLIGAFVCVALLLWGGILYLPFFNKPGVIEYQNIFNSPKLCCVDTFYNDPRTNCPNGLPNRGPSGVIPCSAPNNALAVGDLLMDVGGGFAYFALIWYFLWFVILGVDAYFCIEDPFQLLKQITGAFGGNMQSGVKYTQSGVKYTPVPQVDKLWVGV